MEYTKPAKRYGTLRATLALPAAVVAANLFAREQFTVRADDPLSKKAARSFASALIAPVASKNRLVDTVTVAGMAGVSFEAAKRTTDTKELAVMGIGAQALACAVNAGIERAGWLSPEERQQEDVGFSAVALAWATKFMLDRATETKSKKERVAWGVGAAALVGASTIGSYVTRDISGGKLDAAAHASGVAVGVAAFAIDRHRRR